MKNRRFIKHLVIALTAALVAVSIGLVTKGGNAHGDTTTGTLVGEGGDAMTPVMLSLLSDDASQLLPDTASYTNVNLNQAISDFVGTAPGSFAADFAVSERALTTAEAAQAVADGRSYAYVPFAATPDALMTLVPNSTYDGGSTISASQYCQHIPLSLTQLDGIYGAPQDTDWSALTCPASSTGTSTTTTTGASTTSTTEASTTTTTTASSTPLDAQPIALYGNADPTMENYALMALLDSTSTSQTAYGNLLTTLSNENRADQTSPAPTETWPFPSTAVVGGDEATLGKIVGLVPRTGAPSTEVSQLALGAIMPVASVWTGDPLGVPWNLPTAAVENAAGSFVPPSTTAAAAAEADATLASTSDPTTNNLVTFQPNTNDSAAYNSDLMLESYLVVPTNGLSSDKALALAQLVRFVLGSEGQKDITALGAAPATTAMVTAGLQVAQELDVEAATTTDATAADCSTSTTTTTPSSSTSTSTTPSSSTTTTSTSTTSTTTPTSGSTTTTTVPCTTTTTTTGSTTTGSTNDGADIHRLRADHQHDDSVDLDLDLDHVAFHVDHDDVAFHVDHDHVAFHVDYHYVATDVDHHNIATDVDHDHIATDVDHHDLVFDHHDLRIDHHDLRIDDDHHGGGSEHDDHRRCGCGHVDHVDLAVDVDHIDVPFDDDHDRSIDDNYHGAADHDDDDLPDHDGHYGGNDRR